MNDRPVLNKHLDGDTFRSYYYLKEELTAFCRQNGIPASGGKLELTDRIAHFLDTGEISAASKKPKTKPVYTEITEDTLIEPNFVCSEVHRAFFQSRIGSGFTFLVPFQKWLKTNTGKTYQQAIEAYFQIQQDKKKGRTAKIPANHWRMLLNAGNIKKAFRATTVMKNQTCIFYNSFIHNTPQLYLW